MTTFLVLLAVAGLIWIFRESAAMVGSVVVALAVLRLQHVRTLGQIRRAEAPDGSRP